MEDNNNSKCRKPPVSSDASDTRHIQVNQRSGSNEHNISDSVLLPIGTEEQNEQNSQSLQFNGSTQHQNNILWNGRDNSSNELTNERQQPPVSTSGFRLKKITLNEQCLNDLLLAEQHGTHEKPSTSGKRNHGDNTEPREIDSSEEPDTKRRRRITQAQWSSSRQTGRFDLQQQPSDWSPAPVLTIFVNPKCAGLREELEEDLFVFSGGDGSSEGADLSWNRNIERAEKFIANSFDDLLQWAFDKIKSSIDASKNPDQNPSEQYVCRLCKGRENVYKLKEGLQKVSPGAHHSYTGSSSNSSVERETFADTQGRSFERRVRREISVRDDNEMAKDCCSNFLQEDAFKKYTKSAENNKFCERYNKREILQHHRTNNNEFGTKNLANFSISQANKQRDFTNSYPDTSFVGRNTTNAFVTGTSTGQKKFESNFTNFNQYDNSNDTIQYCDEGEGDRKPFHEVFLQAGVPYRLVSPGESDTDLSEDECSCTCTCMDNSYCGKSSPTSYTYCRSCQLDEEFPLCESCLSLCAHENKTTFETEMPHKENRLLANTTGYNNDNCDSNDEDDDDDYYEEDEIEVLHDKYDFEEDSDASL